MKLLFVQNSLGTGGAERSNADLWYFLRRETDVQLKIVILEHREQGIEQEILDTGFDVVFLPEGNYISQVIQLNKIIKAFQPDIVHSVLFKSVIRVRAAKLLSDFFHVESLVSCSYSQIRMQDPNINKPGLKFYKFLNRLTHPVGTNAFIALTEEVKSHAIEHLKIKPADITVISRGRAENRYLDARDEMRKRLESELKTDLEGPVFVQVGRQEFQKGHMEFLKSIKLIDQELSALNAQIVFCGRKGNSTKEIETFLKEAALQTPVHWLGHRNDIQQILAGSDVFVFPSLLEGLGGALIEAQAAKLPIICSELEVFSEVVKKDENALMFKIGNHAQLSGKILELAESPGKRELMGEKSLENFKENFQIEKIHQQMLNYYYAI